MSDLKRDLVKYVRDRAKSKYDKAEECYICGSTNTLDFHHYCSISEMFTKWIRTNKISINTAEDIKACRDRFIEEHHEQMYNETVTLCHDHHTKLHIIYGRNPVLATAKKQARWVQKQRDKYGLV